MIKFFRNIRHTFLNEGKTTKYLTYAIGEIILVVIGILIAVSINNWNERRKNAISEQQLLFSLKKDIQLNQEELQRVIAKSDGTRMSSDSLLRLIQHTIEPLPTEDLIKLIMNGTGFTIYTTHEGTILDIMGSGKLDLIQSDSIRLAIVSWQVDLRHLREMEIIERNAADDYMSYLKTNLDLYKFNPDSLLSKETEDRIFKDRIYLNLLANRIRLPSILNDYYHREIPKLERLLNHVNNELQ